MAWCARIRYKEVSGDWELVGWYMRDVSLAEPFIIFNNWLAMWGPFLPRSGRGISPWVCETPKCQSTCSPSWSHVPSLTAWEAEEWKGARPCALSRQGPEQSGLVEYVGELAKS